MSKTPKGVLAKSFRHLIWNIWTALPVAFREYVSTIRQADQIVVMDNHKVVDAGHHEKLLGKCSKYRDLIKRQSVMVRDVSLAGMKNFGIIDEDEEEVDGFESK